MALLSNLGYYVLLLYSGNHSLKKHIRCTYLTFSGDFLNKNLVQQVNAMLYNFKKSVSTILIPLQTLSSIEISQYDRAIVSEIDPFIENISSYNTHFEQL